MPQSFLKLASRVPYTKMDIVDLEPETGSRTYLTLDNSQSPRGLSVALIKNKSCLEKFLMVFTACLLLAIVVLGVILALLVKEKIKNEHEVCLTPTCIATSAQVSEAIDWKADPCNNFFNFACGKWIEENVIPEDESTYAIFPTLLRKKRNVILKNVFEEVDIPDEIEAEKKTKLMYKSCLNISQFDKDDTPKIFTLIDELGGWPVLGNNSTWTETSHDLIQLLVTAAKYMNSRGQFMVNTSPVIDVHVSEDIKNTSRNVLTIDQPTLGMMSRDYYLKGRHSKMLDAYEMYAFSMAVKLGADEVVAKKQIEEMVDMEIDMANITIPKEDRQDLEKMYNKMTIAQIGENFTEIDWLNFLKEILKNSDLDTDLTEDVIIRAPSYIRKLFSVLKKYPKRTVANYVVWRVLQDTIKALPLKFQELETQYNKIVLGTKISKPRWKTCIEYLISSMPLAVGRQFVRKAFDKEAKSLAIEMILKIQEEFIHSVDAVDWMDKKTKDLANEKANAIVEKIGYPDDIFNATHLNLLYANITIREGTFLETALTTTKQEVRISFEKLRKPVDKLVWDFSPAMINAFYYAVYNQMVFLAGILQPPFFSRYQPASMNYGGIGVVIGHEITHGFDERGRQYDKDGRLRQWWDDDAIKNFKEKTQCMVEQYDKYTLPELNMTINGARTLSENLADNGGLKMSFLAYKKWLLQHGNIDIQLPGLNLTNKQLFFVNFAQLWCARTRKEHLINTILSDVHSPGKVRVDVSLMNSADFSKAFNCPVGSHMNPKQKCSIW